jgi:ATP-dependent helicase/nuclease subunit A
LEAGGLQVWDKARECHRPFRFSDAAILFRATTDLPLYEDEFKAAGLPYLTVGGRGYYARPEVNDLMALLACLRDPADDLSLAAALRSPLFALSDETLYRLRWFDATGAPLSEPAPFRGALAARYSAAGAGQTGSTSPTVTEQERRVAFAATTMEELWPMVGLVDVWQLLRAAMDRTGFDAALALDDTLSVGTGGRPGAGPGRQRSNVAKFLARARDTAGAGLSEFLAGVRDLQAREAREGEAPAGATESGAVQLMSVHAAKGLEFPVVVVADLGRGRNRRGGDPLVLHDPAFGLVCKQRDENGDWLPPASYRWGQWLDGRMEAAESKRLLYVACSRAADLLILSGQLGDKDSWFSALCGAWGISPKSEPAGVTPAHAADEPADPEAAVALAPAEAGGAPAEIVQRDGFTLRVLHPTPLEETTATQAAAPRHPGLTDMPPLARPLPPVASRAALSVTELGRQLAAAAPDEDGADDPAVVRVAVPTRRDERRAGPTPAYRIGNLVHRALADWDCLCLPWDERQRRLAGYARREGVAPGAIAGAVDRAGRMLDGLVRSPLYTQIHEAAKVYREIPFTLDSPLGVLSGVIDVLYQDRQGAWRLVDWKTERVARDQVAQRAREHVVQVAAYAQAAQRVLGAPPASCLCFLDAGATVHGFTPEDLAAAWREITVGAPAGATPSTESDL